MSRWKSRRIDVPKMAAMTMIPNKPAKASLRMLAKGPLRRTLPFPLPTGPKLSEATQRKEKASQSRKYMYVERLLKRNLNSNVKNSQKSAMLDSSSFES